LLNFTLAKMTKIRGPKPGDRPGQKRKASQDLSTNPHTKKCRDRVENMTDSEKKLERYKNNDRQAQTVDLKKLRKSLSYTNASESGRKAMEEQVKAEVMERR
jgi:hypothetical protein